MKNQKNKPNFDDVNLPKQRPQGEMNKADKKTGNRGTNPESMQQPGVKPQASGRQGSIDVQDGGHDIGSSAGAH